MSDKENTHTYPLPPLHPPTSTHGLTTSSRALSVEPTGRAAAQGGQAGQSGQTQGSEGGGPLASVPLQTTVPTLAPPPVKGGVASANAAAGLTAATGPAGPAGSAQDFRFSAGGASGGAVGAAAPGGQFSSATLRQIPPLPPPSQPKMTSSLYQIPESAYQGGGGRGAISPEPQASIETTTPPVPDPSDIYVDRSMKARVFVLYLVLITEVLFEAYGGTHLGGVLEKIQRRIALAATSGIQMVMHVLLLIAFVASFKDMLYVRLAMYDLFLSEFRWFFLSWALSVVGLGVVRGYRIYNTTDVPMRNIWSEWRKPGLYAAFILERIIQMCYFMVTAASIQLGLRPRLYTRECLEKIWDRFE